MQAPELLNTPVAVVDVPHLALAPKEVDVPVTAVPKVSRPAAAWLAAAGMDGCRMLQT